MLNSYLFSICRAIVLCTTAIAQFPPRPVDLTKIDSTVAEGSRIHYKSVDICNLSGSTRSFSGFIQLPPGSLGYVGLDQRLPINAFFWYFTSKKNAERAPLTLYLNGGPGSSSITPLLRENGPCTVSVDGTGTRTNPWAWTEISNLLYIDQPVNTGFSYDVPVNGTVNFRGERVLREFNSTNIPRGNRVFEAATMGIGSFFNESAVNNTEAAVRSLWLVLSVWLKDFYLNNDLQLSKSQAYELGLWSASYGGHYAAALYDFTTSQNLALEKGISTLPKAPKIRIISIGLTNACVDALVQLPAYPEMAFNNTYGQQFINETVYLAAKKAWEGPGGCRDRIQSCRETPGASPSLGNNATLNAVCHEANVFCGSHIANLISTSNRSFFDIGHHSRLLTAPTLYTHLAFLKQENVQANLGVTVNFTGDSLRIYNAFSRTGDNVRGDYAASLGRALDNGVRVALMYGDRDYACNWLGGEVLSTSLEHKHAKAFQSAGYEPIQFLGGERSHDDEPRARVRQNGNLSFTRVLDSSHTVGTDWPSAAFAIFNRTVSGVDIASGTVRLNSTTNYSTVGPLSVRHIRNQLPMDTDDEEGMCYTLALSFCSDRQLKAYLTGRGKVNDYWLMDYGDGFCSPNPVEPCAIGGSQSLETPGERIQGTVPGYMIYISLMVIAVAVAIWSHGRGKAVGVRYKYRALR